MVLIVAAVWYWRDLRVRVAAVACAVVEILSLGGTQVVRGVTVPPVLLPWHWLAHLPVVSQMLPDRLSILADGLAAVVLAVSLDLALSAAQQPRWRRQGVPLALAAIAVLPLVPLPMHTTQVAAVQPGTRRPSPGCRCRGTPGSSSCRCPTATCRRRCAGTRRRDTPAR